MIFYHPVRKGKNVIVLYEACTFVKPAPRSQLGSETHRNESMHRNLLILSLQTSWPWTNPMNDPWLVAPPTIVNKTYQPTTWSNEKAKKNPNLCLVLKFKWSSFQRMFLATVSQDWLTLCHKNKLGSDLIWTWCPPDYARSTILYHHLH